MLGSDAIGLGSVPIAGGEGGGGGGGGGTISDITSIDGTVVVTNPLGPITNLSVPAAAVAVAKWTGVRVFAVDSSRPDDSGAGFADAPSDSTADIAAATVAAGAVAKKTWAGLLAIIPPYGNDRTCWIVGSGSFAEQFSLLGGRPGYRSIVIRATGTNATAGAVKFTGTAADYACLGAITVPGLNATGYQPTGPDAATDFLSCQKFGGGAPAFPAFPAQPYLSRVRFDSATTTAALRNAVLGVRYWSGGGTPLRVDGNIAAYVGTDHYYLEQAGGFDFPGAQTLQALSPIYCVGLSWGSLEVRGGAVKFSFCFDGAGLQGVESDLTIDTLFDSPPTVSLKVGPTYVNASVGLRGGSINVADCSLGQASHFLAEETRSVNWGGQNMIGGDTHFYGGAQRLDRQFPGFGGANAGLFSILNGAVLLHGARPPVFGALFTKGVSDHAIKLNDTCDLIIAGSWDGVQQNVCGMDISHSVNSRVAFNNSLSDGANAIIVTGPGNRDIFGGTNTNVGGPVYATYIGLFSANGSILLPGPGLFTMLHGPVADESAWQTGASLATIGCNKSGVDIDPFITGAGRLCRFSGIAGDRLEVANIFADTADHAHGAVGLALGRIRNNEAGYVVDVGHIGIYWSDIPGGGPGNGGLPCWLSDTIVGTVQSTPPAPPSIARQVGWSTDENFALLLPEVRPAAQPLALGAGVVALAATAPPGLPLNPVRYVQWPDGAGGFFTFPSWT